LDEKNIIICELGIKAVKLLKLERVIVINCFEPYETPFGTPL